MKDVIPCVSKIALKSVHITFAVLLTDDHMAAGRRPHAAHLYELSYFGADTGVVDTRVLGKDTIAQLSAPSTGWSEHLIYSVGERTRARSGWLWYSVRSLSRILFSHEGVGEVFPKYQPALLSPYRTLAHCVHTCLVRSPSCTTSWTCKFQQKCERFIGKARVQAGWWYRSDAGGCIRIFYNLPSAREKSGAHRRHTAFQDKTCNTTDTIKGHRSKETTRMMRPRC